MLNYVWEFECNVDLKTAWLCLEKVPTCTSNLSFAIKNSRQQLSDINRDQRALRFPSGHCSKLFHEEPLTLPAALRGHVLFLSLLCRWKSQVFSVGVFL